MLGGIACGKTTVLSSIIECAINNPIGQYLTVSDHTLIECGVDSIYDKTVELKNLLAKSPSIDFLVGRVGGHLITQNTFLVQEPGSSNSISLEFLEVPGSMLGSCHDTEIRNKLDECDIITVCVDTPYLMGPIDEQNKDICSESINHSVNCVAEVHNLLMNISNKEKLILFVPLKCEKWAKEGRLGEVNNRIKDVYNHAINALLAYENMNVSIIPIETVGNILFSEFKEPFLITKENSISPKRCCKISYSIVRLEDGRLYKIKDNDFVCQDEYACLLGTNLLKPNSWFNINSKDPSYSPKNGDQLLIHILDFIVRKRSKTRKPFMQYFFSPENVKWLEKILSHLHTREDAIKDKYDIETLSN